jgi:hypothetical protein
MAGKREKPEDIVLKLRQFKGCAGCHSLSISDIPKVLWRGIYRQEGESVKARVRDELLNGEVFTTLREAQILIERWRGHYNTVRPHSALGYRPPAPKSIVPIDQRPTMHYHSNRTTQWGHTKVSATIPMIKLVCRMAMLPIARRRMLCGLYAATLPQRH